jgi:Trk K+ transport system NAD-binding subunit
MFIAVWTTDDIKVLTLVARAFKRLLKLIIERYEVLTAVVRNSCVNIMPCRLILMDVSEERTASKFGTLSVQGHDYGTGLCSKLSVANS